jgi:DNA polymerase-3 subunit beta
VVFAITKDDPKFQLNGALVKLLPGEIEIAATDGHRLAVVRAKAPDDGMPFEQQLFPRKLLSEFARFNDATVVFSAGDNHLGFRMGDRHVISRVVELRFPQYERVIVRDNPNRVKISREDLLGALRRVSLMAHDKAKGVRLKLTPPDELRLVSIGYETGSAEETLPVVYQGDTLEITLNAAYVIDLLQTLTCEMVEIQLRDGKTQCVFVPVEDDPRLEEYIYVLMPMRI